MQHTPLSLTRFQKRKEKKRKAGRKAKNGNELIESDDSEEETSQVPKKKRL